MTINLLNDIRVLDLSRYLAGPFCTWILADLGAEVIKVESCRTPDPLRMEARDIYPEGNPGTEPWNRSGMINDRNRGKYGITCDLKMDRGKEIFKKLVKISDVVVENFQAGVMKKFNLDYTILKAVNPSVVMISLSSQGLTGPEKNYRSFGPTIEETSGLLSITVYPGEPPYISSLAFPDLLAGMLSIGIILAGIRHARKTGLGMHIDLSQRELATSVMGEAVMDYVMNQRVWSAMGNRHPATGPYGCYRCKGEDAWVTIAVFNDEQWLQLCALMEQPKLAKDIRFEDALGRHRFQDELDPIITKWTAVHDPYDVQERLQQVGIPGGAVLNAKSIIENPHLKERSFFKQATHPVAGTHTYIGNPIRFSKASPCGQRPAPCLGEHNAFVYGELLGFAPTEIDELEQQGVIGTVPISKQSI